MLRLPLTVLLFVFLACVGGVGRGIETELVVVTPVFLVAPLITAHDVEVLRLGEVLEILGVGAEVEVVLILVVGLVETIVEVGRTPWLHVLTLLAV